MVRPGADFAVESLSLSKRLHIRELGILPNCKIIGIAQTYFPYMNAFGKDIGQQEREAWREILVKEQFHVLAA